MSDNIVSPRWDISPILRFKDRACFMNDDRMPCGLRNLNAMDALARTDPESRCLPEISLISCCLSIMDGPSGIHIRKFLVEHPIQTPFKTYHRLRGLQMPMDWHLRPHLQRIQHSLRGIFGSRAQIIIHTKTLIIRRLLVKGREKILIN